MTTQARSTSVRTEIVVNALRDRAFLLLTEKFDRIKPREHNMLGVDIAESVFEPRAGGRVYDRGVDGSECQWGRVLTYEPPTRIVFSWDISPNWQIEDDPSKSSEVDRHGEGWEGTREGVAGDQGWPLYLDRFAAAVGETG